MPQTLGGAWWGTMSMFLLHGLIFSTWVSRIPAVQARLALNNAVLGLALLGAAVGSLVAIPVTGWMVTHWGSKRVTTWSAVGFAFTLPLLAAATNVGVLTMALFAFGAMAGMNDVAMNAQGVEVEKRLGKPTMSRFHAMFSIGGMIGAGLGGLIAARHIAPAFHFGAATPLLAGCAIVAASALLETHDGTQTRRDHRLPLRDMPTVLRALCAISFCILLAEGAMADWTAVYLRQVLAAGPGTAAAGYAAFSAAMAIFRLAGDAITARLGNVRTVLTGSIVAAVGLFCALLAPSPGWALPGFAVTGAGFSVIVPLVFGAGGRIENVSPGAGIATVTGVGYLGFLVGPPAIGFIAQLLTLRHALGLVVLLCLASAALSGAVKTKVREEIRV